MLAAEIPIISIDSVCKSIKIDGLTFDEFCNIPESIASEMIFLGYHGEPYEYGHMKRGSIYKVSTRYKPLNNMEMYNYAKFKYRMTSE